MACSNYHQGVTDDKGKAQKCYVSNNVEYSVDYDDKDFDNTGNDNRGCYSSYRSPQIKFDFNSNTLEGHPNM